MNWTTRVAFGVGIVLAVFSFSSASAADAYLGADAVLKAVTDSKAEATPPPAPISRWFKAIAAFHKNSSSIPPAEAARKWLDLADQFFTFSVSDLGNYPPPDQLTLQRDFGASGYPQCVLLALPGPAAWPELASLIKARPPQSDPHKAATDSMLRLLAATLVQDPAAQRKALDELTPAQPSLSAQTDPHNVLDVVSLSETLAERSGEPAAISAAFEAELDRVNTASHGQETFEVPDLVTLLGEKAATPLIAQALMLQNGELNITGVNTRRLAAAIALQQVAKLPSPHWELVTSLETVPLFEAMRKRFPVQKKQNSPIQLREISDYSSAQTYYFINLIVNREMDKAVELAPSINWNSCVSSDEVLDRAGYTQQVHDFLEALLTKHPELPFWDSYIELSARTGQTAHMLDLIRSIASHTGFSTVQGLNAHNSFCLALLAADQVDLAVAELRKIISVGSTNENNPLAKNIALARLGQLLDRPDLLQEGIAGAQSLIKSGVATVLADSESMSSLAELLTEVGRGPEAEQVIMRGIGYSAQPPANRELGQGYLAALVRVYYQARRPDDVIAVLEKFPGWAVSDLKDILTVDTDGFSIANFSSHAAADDFPVGYMAAWAFARKGDTARALKIDTALLDHKLSFDPGYDLLTKVAGQDAIPRLDALARLDRFEPRPLIWKAQLQLDAGKLDEAEKSARAAITIDPSDGAQGPGRRMRAYSVLADVLDRKGDKEHAQFYRGAVTAIRMSEHADRYYEAGLLTRAVRMYQDALTHFADAYCIQSRLALRLAELGDNIGAEEHYRRAYELMPSSFGRVESHCFGCERAFDGPHAQGIAEKVLKGFSEKMPDNPRVHYLLGYLRVQEGRDAEALPEFQKAVALDPDYLNAWKEIADVGSAMRLPTPLGNQVALNIVRLDPLGIHGSADLTAVTDLAGLWNEVAASASLVPEDPGSLFPLTASAAAVAKSPDSDQTPFMPNLYGSWSGSGLVAHPDPASVISTDPFIAAINQMISELALTQPQ